MAAAASGVNSHVEPSIKQGGVQIWPDKTLKPDLWFGGLEDHPEEVMEEDCSEEIARLDSLEDDQMRGNEFNFALGKKADPE